MRFCFSRFIFNFSFSPVPLHWFVSTNSIILCPEWWLERDFSPLFHHREQFSANQMTLSQFQLFKVSNPKSKIFENFRSLSRISFMNSKFFLYSLFLAFYSVPFAYSICHLTIERNVYIKFCLLWLPTNQFSLSLTVCALFWFLLYGQKKKKLNIVRLDDFQGSAVCRFEPRAIHATCNTSLNNGWIRTGMNSLFGQNAAKNVGTLNIIKRRKKLPFTRVLPSFWVGNREVRFFFFAQIVGIIMVVAPLRTIQFVLYNDETSNNNTISFFLRNFKTKYTINIEKWTVFVMYEDYYESFDINFRLSYL